MLGSKSTKMLGSKSTKMLGSIVEDNIELPVHFCQDSKVVACEPKNIFLLPLILF